VGSSHIGNSQMTLQAAAWLQGLACRID